MSYQNSKNNIFHGYLSPKELNGMMIPMTLQHLTLSNYCKKNNAVYSLPTGELVSQNSFFQLFSLLKRLKNKSHIIMCSMYMLPNSETKFQSFKRIIVKKKLIIHCVLENFILKSENEIEKMKQLKKIVNLVDNIAKLKIKQLY